MSSFNYFHVEELDERSRRYLHEVNLANGQGIPGIHASTPMGLFPWLACILGVSLFVLLVIMTQGLILTEPVALALLQTAFFIVGLWLFFLPFRLWIFQKSSRQAGFFLFLDDKYLWQCHARRVAVLRLADVSEVSLPANMDESIGGWVKLKSSQGWHHFKLCHASAAKAINQHLEDYWKGQRHTEDHQVPDPFRYGKEKWEVKTLLAWVVLAVLGFYAFRASDISWRDDFIWESIQEVHPDSGQIYWLRLYLREPRNIHHRDLANAHLSKLYKDKLLAIQNIRVMDHPLPDPDLFSGIEGVLQEMGKSLEPAILKFSMRFAGDRDAASEALEKEAAHKYSEALFQSLGQDYVIVAGPIDPPAHIEITWDWVTQGAEVKVKFLVKYRVNSEGEPFKTAAWEEKVRDKSLEQVGLAAKGLATRTVNFPEAATLP